MRRTGDVVELPLRRRRAKQFRSIADDRARLYRLVPENEQLLIEQAFLEMNSTCLNIALTTSALNHLNLALDWHGSGAHFQFEPPQPVLIKIISMAGSMEALNPALSIHINLMLLRLDTAKRQLRRFKEESKRLSTLRERDDLVDAWSSLADAALLTFDDFENLASNSLGDVTLTSITLKSDELRSGLIASRDGGTPWLANGIPCRPAWAEYRRCRRVPLNVDGHLRHRGRVRPIRIRDASEGGLGIEFCGELEPSEIVVITLESGRRLVGSVAWCHTNRAGITLATPLFACDPILSGL